MADGDDETTRWVLGLDLVKWAIDVLTQKRAHPFFLAYLHLRARSMQEGQSSHVTPRWQELGRYLEVPGGPPRKPYYRPLYSQVGKQSQYWLNENLAGSYAPSSLRANQRPLRVVTITEDGAFGLREDHAALAREHLLYGTPVLILPLAAFLYRNYGFHASEVRPRPGDLVEVFAEDWHFTDLDDSAGDFKQLFDWTTDYDAPDWFEQSEVDESEPAVTRQGRTEQPIRTLSADELGIGRDQALREHASNRPDDAPIAEDHPLLEKVRDLLQFYGGVIFSGPPGTSKSYFAANIGKHLADFDDSRIRFVQFHPSYQYEDFIQGYVPRSEGGFELQPRYFLEMCKAALGDSDRTYVLVIDELSRGDPGRVFGEALTYVERSKRGMRFTLASGTDCVVPENLVILATMNPLDRGVDEVDAAFGRRFARIGMDPERSLLEEFLDGNDVIDPLRQQVLGLFDMMNGRARTNPYVAVGHTYFREVRDAGTLQSIWDHQIRFIVESAYRLDPDSYDDVVGQWNRAITSARELEMSRGADTDSASGAIPSAPAEAVEEQP